MLKDLTLDKDSSSAKRGLKNGSFMYKAESFLQSMALSFSAEDTKHDGFCRMISSMLAA